MIKIIPKVINISAILKVNQWKSFTWKSIKSGTALYISLSNQFPNAPPIMRAIDIFSNFLFDLNSQTIKNVMTKKIKKLNA